MLCRCCSMVTPRHRLLSGWGSQDPTCSTTGRNKWCSRAGPAARSLGDRVAQLEDELRRVERERDILKKALGILSRQV